jgi:transcriptional regulator with XRE-family HTH domain
MQNSHRTCYLRCLEAGVGEAARVLGRELRRLRQERGLSQRALTKLLGLTAHSNIADYESGRRIPPRDIISSCDRLLETDGDLGRLLTRALAEKALGEAPPPPPSRRRRHLVTIVALAIAAIGLLAWSLPRSGPRGPVAVTVTVTVHLGR